MAQLSWIIELNVKLIQLLCTQDKLKIPCGVFTTRSATEQCFYEWVPVLFAWPVLHYSADQKLMVYNAQRSVVSHQ